MSVCTSLPVYESSSLQTFGPNFRSLQKPAFLFASYKIYEPSDHARSSHATTTVSIYSGDRCLTTLTLPFVSFLVTYGIKRHRYVDVVASNLCITAVIKVKLWCADQAHIHKLV